MVVLSITAAAAVTAFASVPNGEVCYGDVGSVLEDGDVVSFISTLHGG